MTRVILNCPFAGQEIERFIWKQYKWIVREQTEEEQTQRQQDSEPNRQRCQAWDGTSSQAKEFLLPRASLDEDRLAQTARVERRRQDYDSNSNTVARVWQREGQKSFGGQQREWKEFVVEDPDGLWVQVLKCRDIVLFLKYRMREVVLVI